MKTIKYYMLSIITFLLMTGFVSSYFEITKNLEIFNNIYREINTYYVDPVDPGELMHSTIDTMLKRLDPYTKYIPESEIEDFRFQTTGDYGGIGATIRKIDETVVIYEPYKDFPRLFYTFIEAYRLLVNKMRKENMFYPLHLGVTRI